MQTVLAAGIYRHYKNHLYLLLGQGQDANNESRIVVVYVGLDLDGARCGYRLKVRTLEDFLAAVDPETGEPCAEPDRAVPRYTYVGPSIELG